MRTIRSLVLAVVMLAAPAAVAAVRGDFNGDGKPDIVWSNPVTGANAIWLMNGTALQAVVDLPALPAGYSIQGTGDFNGDGHNDVVVRNPQSGANAIWPMNGTSFSSIVDLPGVAPYNTWRVLGTGNYNGDSSADIFLRTDGMAVYVWLMQGTSYTSSTYTSQHDFSNIACRPAHLERAQAVVDVNNDGWVDTVGTDVENGNRRIELVANQNGVGYYCLPLVTNVSIEFSGGADFNADGKSDLLLRNIATGANAVWLMDGTTLLGVVDLPALPNTDYVVGGPR